MVGGVGNAFLPRGLSVLELWQIRLADAPKGTESLVFTYGGPADMLCEPGESEGRQVLRHLKVIVAWYAAATTLLARRFRDVDDGLVEVIKQPEPMNR